MNKPAAPLTIRLLQRRTRALDRHLPAAIAGDDRGVHRARVATRRLREAVPVLASGLKHAKVRNAARKLRRLTRALGEVREADVSLHLLDELEAAGHLPAAAIHDVRAHVSRERDRRRGIMLERLGHVKGEKLARRLASVRAELEASPSDAWRGVLGTRLLKRTRVLRAAIDDAGQLYMPERLHAVRIAAKKLRYALELAADSETAATLHVRTTKRAQALLGRLHDLQILQAHVAERQAEPLAGGPGMDAAFDVLTRHLEDACRHLHARYLGSTAALRNMCQAISADVVPQLDPPHARRSLKMALPTGAASAAGGSRR